MIQLYDTGAYLVNGTEIIPNTSDGQAALKSKLGGQAPTKEEAARNTDHSGNGASACSDHRGYAKRMQG